MPRKLLGHLSASERRLAIVMYAIPIGVMVVSYLYASPWILVGGMMLLARFLVDVDD